MAGLRGHHRTDRTSTFEGGSVQVLSIDLGYHLVGLVAAGIILAS